jgi:hypothetical protein
LRSDNASYARTLERAHNLSRFSRRDRESLPITSRARNERNANAEEALDFMHGRITSRHEGWVSTMLTESDFSIALPVGHFKGLYDEMGDARPQARHFGVLSVLTSRGCD